jgi:hypothetical protein
MGGQESKQMKIGRVERRASTGSAGLAPRCKFYITSKIGAKQFIRGFVPYSSRGVAKAHTQWL